MIISIKSRIEKGILQHIMKHLKIRLLQHEIIRLHDFFSRRIVDLHEHVLHHQIIIHHLHRQPRTKEVISRPLRNENFHRGLLCNNHHAFESQLP